MPRERHGGRARQVGLNDGLAVKFEVGIVELTVDNRRADPG